MKLHIAFAAGALFVAACSPDPVDPAVVAPDEDLAGDASADGLAAPANAAASEAAQRAAIPIADNGLTWSWRAETRSALYGAPSAPQLSITCREGVLHITRHAPIENAAGTLSFTGNGHAASLPVVAEQSQLGPGSLSTTALKPGDMTNAVARVLAGKGPVNVTLGGAPSLVTPPSDLPARAFAACR